MENLIRNLVKQYKRDFLKYWEGEKYKWQAVKWFQDNWNIDASDFGSMFEHATNKTDYRKTIEKMRPDSMLEFAKQLDELPERLATDETFVNAAKNSNKETAMQQCANSLIMIVAQMLSENTEFLPQLFGQSRFYALHQSASFRFCL